MNKIYIFRTLFSIFALLAIVVPCEAKKKNTTIKPVSIQLPTRSTVSQRYGNLDYGIRIQVRNEAQHDQYLNLSELSSKELGNLPNISFEESPEVCAEQYLDSYATNLGLKVGTSSNSDFILRVTIKDFRLRIREYDVKKKNFSSSGAMVISWELVDPEYQQVIASTTSMGRGSANTLESLYRPYSESFKKALDGIDWDRIASQLKIAKTARQEKNKEVTGAGNTALEHTVIRWYIISKPQGADVSWRVVSSTPDVANTNANFVGTTPYESTEAFDIKGLTYNNSGNVQIEVTCERDGYLPQKKRFNLRQAIDQKEISAKFNLVKESEEE